MSNARLRSNLHFKRTYDGKDVVEPYAMLDVLHTKIAPSGTLRTHSADHPERSRCSDRQSRTSPQHALTRGDPRSRATIATAASAYSEAVNDSMPACLGRAASRRFIDFQSSWHPHRGWCLLLDIPYQACSLPLFFLPVSYLEIPWYVPCASVVTPGFAELFRSFDLETPPTVCHAFTVYFPVCRALPRCKHRVKC